MRTGTAAGRVWRLLLTLALVPAVVLATTDAAVADTYPTSWGSPKSYTVEKASTIDGLPHDVHNGDGFECSGTAVLGAKMNPGVQGPGTNPVPFYTAWVKYSAKCTTQFNIRTATLQALDFMDGDLSCEFLDGRATQIDGGATWSATANPYSADGTGAVDRTTCNVDTVCMTVAWESWAGAGDVTKSCESIDLGAPPEASVVAAPGVCPWGSISPPTFKAPERFWWDSDNRSLAQVASLPVAATGASPVTEYYVYAVVKPTNGSSQFDGSVKGDRYGWYTIDMGRADVGWAGTLGLTHDVQVMYATRTAASLASNPSTGTLWTYLNQRHTGAQGGIESGGPAHGVVQGFGIIPKKPNYVPGWDWNSGQRYGQNDPAACMFYWGEKLRDVAGTTLDEPQSDLSGVPTTPVDDPGPEVPVPDDTEAGFCGNFSFTDPSTWAAGGICALVSLVGQLIGLVGDVLGVLGDVLDALLGLVAELLEGLLGLLMDLFVPDGAVIEDALDSVKDAWSDSPPFALLDGVGDVGDALSVSNPGGGCQGPPLTVKTPDGIGGESVTIHPMSSCGEGLSLLASIVKTALTVGVYVGGFLVAVRVISSALGVSIDLGRGADV